jgi:hypothetical protein
MEKLHRELSEPFLIDLTAHNYPEAETKLVIVGKQTNGWGWDHCPIPGDDVAKLLFTYKDFSLGRNRYMKTFFQAAHQLYNLLNPQGPENGFIWTNLFKVDEKNGRPESDLESILFDVFNVLPTEIELAEPDVVVFFTGPNDDDFLTKTFPEVEFMDAPVEPPEERSVLARVTNLRAPNTCPQAFRLYHPTALRIKKKWRLVSEIPKLVGAARHKLESQERDVAKLPEGRSAA